MSPVTRNGKRGQEVHRSLLSDPKVRAWYDERALRSKLSADTYLRQLGGSLSRLNLTPSGIAELAEQDPDALRAALVKYAGELKQQGRLDSYIGKTFDGLRSWLRFRRAEFDSFPKLGSARGVTLEQERVPTPEELQRVLARLSPRGRVAALFMAHSGLRPGVLGGYGALDGLRLGDLPELKLGKQPTLSVTPFVIRVPARLSKTRRMYTTFGSQELASALLGYLDERQSHGERLGSDSPAITVDSFAATHEFQGKRGAGRFLTTKGIVFEIREALSSAKPNGVSWRPYVLRSYCSTRLLIAEGQGKIGRDLREAILGHDGGVAARYNVGKRWGPELLKEARSAYKRCEPFLSTSPTASAADRDFQTRRVMLRIVGYTEEDLSKIDLAAKTDDELIALADARRQSQSSALRQGQRAVAVTEVGPMLEAGWEYVAPLGLDRVILRGSSGVGGFGGKP
jgi:hypothetical protein